MGEKKYIAIVRYPEDESEKLIRELNQAGQQSFEWMELPPIHMLGRNTDAEQMVYDYLLGRTDKGSDHFPNGILAIINASELERQLYLVFQLIDLRLPIILALSHHKSATQKGIRVDEKRLAKQLGIHTIHVDVDGGREEALRLTVALEETLDQKSPQKSIHWRPSIALANAYHHLDRNWIYEHLKLHSGARLIEGLRLLSGAKASDEYASHPAYDALLDRIEEARALLTQRNENWAMAEVLQRHNWIGQAVSASVSVTTTTASSETTRWENLKKLIQRGFNLFG